MNQIDAIKSLFESWKDCDRHRYSFNTDKEFKLMFLSDGILGLTTYDGELDIEFGQMILDTMIQIKNRTTFEYIENKDNYKKYILSCNFLDGWLDWGGSIRGAWFDYYGGKFTPSEFLSNIGYDKDCIDLNEEFIDWLIEFLSE